MPIPLNPLSPNIHSHWITASGQEGTSGSAEAHFPYWSFTKTVIAICALKLVEEGMLDLDTKIDGKAYSLRQLLAHTAGLPDYGQFPEYGAAVTAGQTPWSRDKMLDLALSKGMLFEPGQGWSYSNVGYLLIREELEVAVGKPWGDIADEQVCAPLGLTSIELAQTRDQFTRLHWPAAANYDPNWVYHGCLTGTASDATRLLHGLFSGQLLQPETLAMMSDEKRLGGPIPGRPWQRCGYALGLMTGAFEGVGRALGHSGAGPFCVNAVYHFPDLIDPLTMACFTNGTEEGVAEFAITDFAATRMNRCYTAQKPGKVQD